MRGELKHTKLASTWSAKNKCAPFTSTAHIISAIILKNIHLLCTIWWMFLNDLMTAAFALQFISFRANTYIRTSTSSISKFEYLSFVFIIGWHSLRILLELIASLLFHREFALVLPFSNGYFVSTWDQWSALAALSTAVHRNKLRFPFFFPLSLHSVALSLQSVYNQPFGFEYFIVNINCIPFSWFLACVAATAAV